MRARLFLGTFATLALAACAGQSPPPAAPQGGGEAGAETHAEAQSGHGHGHGHGKGTPEGHQHSFSDVDSFAKRFDDPARDERQKPAEVVALLALAPGLTVADIGAGTGYFLPHLAPAVQPGGRVLALDLEPNMVAHMKQRIAREKLAGAEARKVAPDDPGLGSDAVDRVLFVNTWHHVGAREDYARTLYNAVRPGGFVLIVDLTMEADYGPPLSARLSPEQVSAEFEQAGFGVAVLEESLPDQYVVRATKAP
ncbi:class I SAM-dependent methyltransferase [Haliangium ochraceum]|uniref:Methyltransferase type 11 n=1 Tax=Haliangium ochraceum (strain DSM 14365 / JCM 11303 / SMP-2) TaxID=502025 RepID=D0LT46_HALO1|nr:methyltransferase [Haliangium ochraceum]ACY19182.1 Methyltransferase type 11 [Haliangium ochraceum DSM 14365]